MFEVPKMSRFTRFFRGKIWFVDIGPCKRFDIFQVCPWPGVRSMGPGLHSLRLVFETSNREILVNVSIKVAPPGDQISKQCKLCHMVAKFSNCTCWIKRPRSGGGLGWHWVGKVVTDETGIPINFSCIGNSSFTLNGLGPLCLWQCFILMLSLQRTMVNHILYSWLKSSFEHSNIDLMSSLHNG